MIATAYYATLLVLHTIGIVMDWRIGRAERRGMLPPPTALPVARVHRPWWRRGWGRG